VEDRGKSQSDTGNLHPAAPVGEYTQLFQPSRGDVFAGAEHEAIRLPVNEIDESARKPGEFTQFFQPSAGDSFVSPEAAPRKEVERIAGRSEPGFDTLFGSAPGSGQPPQANDSSGTAILPASSSPPVEKPEDSWAGATSASPPVVRPQPTVPPTPVPDVVVKPSPVLKPEVPLVSPKPWAAGAPPAGRFPEPIAKQPEPPSPPRIPPRPKPPLARPPIPKPGDLLSVPKGKPPATPELLTHPQAPEPRKPGPSTFELILILGGLLLVVVAAILLIELT
jgi:hypothetical protein